MVKSVTEAMKSYNSLFEEAKMKFVRRHREIECLRYAILMQEHVLYKGLPGTGKSLLATSILSAIQPAKLFKQQFNRYMDDTFIFGPLNVEKMKAGVMEHTITDSLVDADYAFLDEFFNASEELLVSCNELLNERKFTRFSQKVDCPLKCAVLTTNRNREKEEELKPIYDRIMFTVVVGTLPPRERMEMLCNYAAGGVPKLEGTIAESQIQRLRSAVQKVEVPLPVIRSMSDVVDQFLKEHKMFISDRKMNKFIDLLRVSAILAGRTDVRTSDLKALYLVLADTRDAQSQIASEGTVRAIVAAFKDSEDVWEEQRKFAQKFSTENEVTRLQLLITAYRKELVAGSAPSVLLGEIGALVKVPAGKTRTISGMQFPEFNDLVVNEMLTEAAQRYSQNVLTEHHAANAFSRVPTVGSQNDDDGDQVPLVVDFGASRKK